MWEQLRTAALRRLQALPPEAQVAVMTLAPHAGAVPPRYASLAVAARVIEAADAHPGARMDSRRCGCWRGLRRQTRPCC
ncbi:hypothetical protein E6W36_01320 [Hankyongella ginsenosidimutans]|uniref:Uncharacterized protein n=1 Tax=Hankyongella ginsenosidimutans TaxID=1763828 RepID=A0A4D7C5B8_9SPHN|nr:hypothetical protein E6W36_01320 [Hankyongella ginsenosidimutans]